MSGSVNKVILVGRLGKDPELKFTASGVPFCKFTLATDESFKDKAGTQQKRTEWHNIVAWNKLAEICGEYLAKGKQVYVEGQIRTSQSEKEGVRRTFYDIVINHMQMLGSKGDGQPTAQGATPAPAAPGKSAPAPEPEISDEDIPF